MEREPKYLAFISYSHKDRRIARWLHKEIENYKIPKSLYMLKKDDGTIKYPNLPNSLKRTIFRDEEELPVGGELPVRLKKALDNSKNLIVLCSPHAVGIHKTSNSINWIDEEILYFKCNHGEEKILGIIIDGEPNASNYGVNDEKYEAFPQALRYRIDQNCTLSQESAHPVAADARKRSFRRRALIRIIATILDVDFADLWRRDKKAQRIKMFFISAVIGIFIAIGAFAYYTWMENREYLEHSQTFVELNVRLLKVKKQLKKDPYNPDLKREKENLEDKLEIIKNIDTLYNQIDDKILKKAIEIFYNSKDIYKGAKASLDFLNSEAIKQNEDKKIEKLLALWLFKARSYRLTNDYNNAESYYDKSLSLDFSFENALEYANFLYKQNNFKKAEKIYKKILKLSLDITKKTAVLNNLAVLESDLQRYKEAKKYYLEALKIYRKLAQDNPQAYNLYLAKTLLIGVSIFDAPLTDLYTVRQLLRPYKELPEAKKLLEITNFLQTIKKSSKQSTHQ